MSKKILAHDRVVKEILLPRFGHKYVLVRGVNELALRRPPLIDWTGQVLYEAIGVNTLKDMHRIDWSSDQRFVDF